MNPKGKNLKMSIVKRPVHIYEPTPLQCGQATLAMLTGESVERITELCGTDRETTLADMKMVLDRLNVKYNPERKQAFKKEDLPTVCLLSLETPRCWHWSLYFDGVFYDPEHGVLDDFPISNRKYYWEVSLN